MNQPTAKEVSEEISALLRANGLQSATVKWPRFYEMTGRDRITEPFLENLAQALKAESIVMAKGVAVLVFSIDYDFAPLPSKQVAS